MTIKLWDPGEGGQQIRILNNQGAAVQFDYTVSTPCSTGCSGTVLASSSGLSISGSGTQSPNRVGTSKFNDRMVTLTVTIPAGYASTAATANGWWKIDYNPGVGNASISDRTTWQVSVSGNPVHLLNG
jgi:hypothetical protein